MAQRFIIVSDLQCPYQRVEAVKTLANFIKANPKATVLCVGDVCDFPSLSRWNSGLRGEYDLSLSDQRDEAVEVLKRLRVEHLCRSNHEERLEKYIAQKAPALEGLDELTIEKFLKLDKLGIQYHRKPYQFTPGWFLLHGDEGGLSSEPGKTALGLARKVGASVVCGHTHRAGLQPLTESVGGRVVRVRYGMEVGCLMDMEKAEYIDKMAGSVNWQLGFGVIDVDGFGRVDPRLVFMHDDGSFLFDGRVWN